MAHTDLPTPGRTLLTLAFTGGAQKAVLYVGARRDPRGRVLVRVHWPTAGDFEISPRSGRLVGNRKLRCWKLVPEDLKRVRLAHRAAKREADAAG